MIARLVLATLLVGMAACSPQPRSVDYFQAHQAEAEKVVADCRTGAHRGQECVNAQAGVAASRRHERLDAYRKGF